MAEKRTSGGPSHIGMILLIIALVVGAFVYLSGYNPFAAS